MHHLSSFHIPSVPIPTLSTTYYQRHLLPTPTKTVPLYNNTEASEKALLLIPRIPSLLPPVHPTTAMAWATATFENVLDDLSRYKPCYSLC